MNKFRLEVSEAAARSIRNRRLSRDEVLFSIGAPVECVFRVIRGSVRIIAYPEGGKHLVLYRANQGETFSEDHLVCDNYRYAAIASEKTVVASICRGLLVRELQEKPAQLYLFLECVIQRFQQLHANFQRLAIPDAKTRVLDFLRNYPVSSNGTFERIKLKGKTKGYADDLNLSHEAVYRALRKLESEGSIYRLDDGSVKVLSKQTADR